jgi:hypothetical protein
MYTYLVHRCLEGDEWNVVKAFSTEELCNDYIKTVAQVSANVYWRMSKVPLDTVSPAEPYSIVKELSRKHRADLRDVFECETRVSQERYNSLGEMTAPLREAMDALVAAKEKYDRLIDEDLKTLSAEDGSLDEALLALPAYA